MGDSSTVIHCNSGLKHQVKLAKTLQKGTGWKISYLADEPAETHVVLGPWFALKHWKNANTLYIDRAYWQDPLCVSVHWLTGGEKLRTRNRPYRAHPELHPMKRGNRRIYLCDYLDAPTGKYDSVRWHPAQRMPRTSLEDDLNAHDVAIGRRTTALVDAAIKGLRVETSDPHSPVYGLKDREQWIRDLAWHNWAMDELASGEFLDGIGKPDSPG